MRAFLVVTHLLGAGHLTRAAALARAFAEAGHEVTLVSGGTPAPLVDTRGVALVQLPPVRAFVDDFSTLRDPAGAPVDARYLARRRGLLRNAFAAAKPDVVVTELYPFGRRALAGELEDLLEAVERASPRPALLSSVRDILVAPDRAEKVARTHDLVERRYDAVLVHGDEAVTPLDASWPVDDRLRARLIYTGFVGPEVGPASRPEPDGRGTVLVSGGSSAAALPLYRAALDAARLVPDRPWHVLVGAAVDAADVAGLGRFPNVTIERARPDFRDLLSKAAVFVGQAGYNTVMDIVATQARAVLVPFERGRETEQRLRADALAVRGLATVLAESELDGTSLARAVAAATLRPRPSFAGTRLDGAAVAVRCVESLVAARSGQGTGR